MQGGIKRTAAGGGDTGSPCWASCLPYSSMYSSHWPHLEAGLSARSLRHPAPHPTPVSSVWVWSWPQGTFSVTVRGQCPDTRLFRCPLATGAQIYPCGWAWHWKGSGEPQTSPALRPRLGRRAEQLPGGIVGIYIANNTQVWQYVNKPWLSSSQVSTYLKCLPHARH